MAQDKLHGYDVFFDTDGESSRPFSCHGNTFDVGFLGKDEASLKLEALWTPRIKPDLKGIDSPLIANINIKDVIRRGTVDPVVNAFLNAMHASEDYDLMRDYSRLMPHYIKDIPHPNDWYSGDINPDILSWGIHGIPSLKNGWSCIAQARNGQRLPERVHGTSFQNYLNRKEWHVFKMLSSRCHQIPLPVWSWPVWSWQVYNPMSNISAIMGGEARTVAIDIDVMDAEKCKRIVDIAFRILGQTDFIRQGKTPKIALIYRARAGEDIASASPKLDDGGYNGDPNMVEVLSNGKQITIFGVHHSGKYYFRWLGDKNPAFHGPENAPEITRAQVQAFMDAIQAEISPFMDEFSAYNSKRGIGITQYKATENGRMRVADSRNYEIDGGMISDGRNVYAGRLTYSVASEYQNEIPLRGKISEELINEIVDRCINRFMNTALTDGRWDVSRLPNEFSGRVRGLLEKYQSGDVHFKQNAQKTSSVQAIRLTRKETSKATNTMDDLLSGVYLFGIDRSEAYVVPDMSEVDILPLPRLPGSLIIGPNVKNIEVNRLHYGCETLARYADFLIRQVHQYEKKTDFRIEPTVHQIDLLSKIDVDEVDKLYRILEHDVNEADNEHIIPVLAYRYAEYLLYMANLEWNNANIFPQSLPMRVLHLFPQRDFDRRSAFLKGINLDIAHAIVGYMNELIYEPVQEIVVKNKVTGRRRKTGVEETQVDIVEDVEPIEVEDVAENTFEKKTRLADDLSFLGDHSVTNNDRVQRVFGNSPLEFEDRSHEISDNLQGAIDRSIHDAYGFHRGEFEHTQLDIIKAPTGAGKTSHTIQTLIGDPRTYEDVPVMVGDRLTYERRPIVILMPNYNNIYEAVARARMLMLNPDQSDEDLAQDVFDTGFSSSIEEAKDRIENIRSMIRGTGRMPGAPTLNIEVFSGKIKAGCQMKTMIGMLQEAGIGAGALCKGNVWDNEAKESVEKTCEFYNECSYIAQFERLKTAHIIFMPHAMYSSTLPDVLQKVRMVIVDENVTSQFTAFEIMSHDMLNESRFVGRERKPIADLDTLSEEARDRFLKREQKAEEMNADSLLRDHVIENMLNHVPNTEGDIPDVAQWFYDIQMAFDAGRDTFIDRDIVHAFSHDVGEALTRIVKFLTMLCGRDGSLYPNMPQEDVERICAQPGNISIRSEIKFWEMVYDRFCNIVGSKRHEATRKECQDIIETYEGVDDDLMQEYVADARLRLLALGNNDYIVHGKKDARIQFLKIRIPNALTGLNEIQEALRVSWRSKPNWIDTPTILLDASASPEIVERIWGLENPVRVCNVVEDDSAVMKLDIVAVNNASYSNNMLVSNAEASLTARIRAGINVDTIRSAITRLSGLYGFGRVVVGAGKTVRRVITDNWGAPENVDFCHYGAMRGIDAYKEHVACISIGRMEPPVEVIDAIAGALTYDDAEPESPFNIYGNGFEDKEATRPLFQPSIKRRVRMRDGGHSYLDVPVVPRKWGARIQNQYREEEIIQLIGRLRPIYRDRRAVHFLMSNVVPESLILDDICHVTDIIGVDDTTRIAGARNVPLDVLRHRKSVRVMSQIQNASRLQGEIIVPALMLKDWRDQISNGILNTDMLRDYLVKMGFLYARPENIVDGNYMEGRETRGYACVEWKYGEQGTPDCAFIKIASCYQDDDALNSEIVSAIKDMIASSMDVDPDNIFVRIMHMPNRVKGFLRRPDELTLEQGGQRGCYERQCNNEDMLYALVNMVNASGEQMISIEHGKSVDMYRLSPMFLSVLAEGLEVNPQLLEEAVMTAEQFRALMDIENIHGRSIDNILYECEKLAGQASTAEDTMPF